MSRPTLRTPELEDDILSRIACGESLRAICSEEAYPNVATVIRWLAADEAFAHRYARAREMQAEVLADQMLEIADDGTNDWMAKKDREGNLVGWQLNGEAVARSKLRLEQRRWYAEKLRPKVYGAKVAVGGDPDAPPIKTTHQLDVSNLTLEELDVLGAALQKSLTRDDG
jgi:hypothetical protein